jgi:hypothetical protein
MSKKQKQKILENKIIKYEEMDQSKKEELLTKNLNYRKTMSKEQKRKPLGNKRVNMKQWINQRKRNCLLKI